jgi:hypothetical protein
MAKDKDSGRQLGGLNTEEVIKEIRMAIARHLGSEKELLEALMTEADGWDMRLEELGEDEEELDDDEECPGCLMPLDECECDDEEEEGVV